MSEVITLPTPDYQEGADPFAAFADQANVDAEFASMFGLDDFEPAITELGGTALEAALADGMTYADAMNAQADAAGIAPLTAENIEAEVAELYTALAMQEKLREEEMLQQLRARSEESNEDPFTSARRAAARRRQARGGGFGLAA